MQDKNIYSDAKRPFENTHQLDKADIMILHQLDLNCRSSYNSIGKKARHSKEYVRYRVNRLVENKIIDQFITSIDYSKLGMYRICMYIKFIEITPDLRHKIIQYRSTKDCRIKTFSVGKFDLYLDLAVSVKMNIDTITHEFITIFGKSISEISINLLYKIKHYKNRYIYGKLIGKPFISDYIGANPMEISKEQLAILNALRKNPRISTIDISALCRLSPKTIVTKISELKHMGVITGFCIKLNNQKIGKEDYIILLKLNDKSTDTKSKIESYLDTINEVSYMGKLIGEYDLEFALTVNSQNEFMHILDKMRSSLKKEIRDFNVLFLSPLI